jgi:hypothetical protein
MIPNQTELRLLNEIVGQELSSVEFVQDYVQLRFNGAVLTAYTQPTVKEGQRVLQWGEPGYRDHLCEQIGQRVKSVAINGGRAVTVNFGNDVSVQISLEDDDYRGAEAVMFTTLSGEWWVL